MNEENTQPAKLGFFAWIERLDSGGRLFLSLALLLIPTILCWLSIAAVKDLPASGARFPYADYDVIIWLPVVFLSSLAIAISISLIITLTAKLLRGRPDFEIVMIACILACLPWVSMESILIQAEASATFMRPVMWLICVSAVLTIILTVVLLAKFAKLGWIRGTICSTYIAVFAVGIGIFGHWEEEPLISGVRKWNVAKGSTADLFYGAELDKHVARLFAYQADRDIEELCHQLGLKGVSFRPQIYIIYDKKTFDLYADDNGDYVGKVLMKAVLLRQKNLVECPCVLTHELTHIVSADAFGENQSSLLNEGLAEYMMHKLTYRYENSYCTRKSFLLSIRTLSDDETFENKDLMEDNRMDVTQKYANAESLVSFLISRYGWKSYLEFHRLSSVSSNPHVSAMESASQKVFHTDLRKLNQDWTSWSIQHQPKYRSKDKLTKTNRM